MNQKGVTLVEVLVTISITAIVSTLLVGIFTQNNRLFSNQQAKISHGISSNEVINKIDDAIRGAATIETSYPAQNPTYTSGSSVLVLKLPSVDANGSVISNSYDYLVFTKDQSIPTILRQILYPSAQSSRHAENQVLTNDLKSIAFSYLNDSKTIVSPPSATLVSYNLVLSSNQVNTTVESSASGQTRLRNN